MAEASICTICQNLINDDRDYLTTRCHHMFHTECIAKNANINDNKCPNCREPIPSFRNIFTGYENKKTDKKKNDEILSYEDDDDNWDCPVCTFKNSNRSDMCNMCNQGMRIQVGKVKPKVGIETSIQDELRPTYECSTPQCHTLDSTSSILCDRCITRKYSSASNIYEDNQQITSPMSSYSSVISSNNSQLIKSKPNKWRCDICNYTENITDNEICIVCQIGQQSEQLESFEQPTSTKSLKISDRSMPPSSYREEQKKQSTSKTESEPVVKRNSTMDNQESVPEIVYITDLPGDKTNHDLEEQIYARLHHVHNINILNVQSFSELGVAIIRLSKQKDKDYLVNTLQSFVLFPNDNIKVTLTEQLEVKTYLVFDAKSTIPSNDSIMKRWNEVFISNSRPIFEILSIQFSNIIQVKIHSIEVLQTVAKHKVLSVEDQVARFYTHVDCSYLEELPNLQPKLDENRIFCFIATQIDMSDRERLDKRLCLERANNLFQQIQSPSLELKELKSKFRIQYNEKLSTAVILASNSMHRWLSMTFLNINDQFIFKTTNTSNKLIIKSIPSDFPLHLIYNHPIFNHSIKTHTNILNGEHLIVEINDKKAYDECLKIRVLDVKHNGDDVILQIVPYTPLKVSGNSDINVDNWYGAQMQKFKPDITEFADNHPIFRYKWNSKIWLEQFQQNKQESERSTNLDDRRQNDFIRRMLRVTVMLNTMAIMRQLKYTYENSSTKTDILIEPKSPLVTILYNDKSKLFPRTQTVSLPPFDSTHVRVINEDCLIAYNALVLSGRKPVLLNMANAATPGGGYRKGDGAQEENLFRRSNYYMSLDYNMDKEQNRHINFQRNSCLPSGQISSMNNQESLYPIDEYGAIYTSGITVLRDVEDKGYPYLKEPLYDVCAIAIAAYRDPQVHKDTQRLTGNIAIGTRKKIENLFAIAYKHQHDSLVLSAFGCGAFKNPPEHIALIFKSIIIQYAGFFKEIVFAIIDDHNTGGRLNRAGNFLPFQQVLDGFVVHPPTVRSIGMSLGPYRLIPTKSQDNHIEIQDFIINDMPLCIYGTGCINLNDQNHCQTNIHPPLCPYGSQCKENTNDVHLKMFIHRQKCSDQGQCTQTDRRHFSDFDHPEYCSNKGHCNDIKIDHLNAYRHVPICPYGQECYSKLAGNTEHIVQFRHCQQPCRYGGNCINFHDQKHIINEKHPFNQPCPFTPLSCKIYTEFLQSNINLNKPKQNPNDFNDTEKHCYRYSHICPWGGICDDKSEQHLSMTIHIIRHMCPDDTACKKMLEEDHLNSFSHSNVRDIRLLCRSTGAKCLDRTKAEHIKKYRHNYTLDYLGVSQYFALNKRINFIQNQFEMIDNIRGYTENEWKKVWKKISVSDNLLNWIAALQPIHRCKPSIFESILVHGHVMSRSYMDKLENSSFVANIVYQHARMKEILVNHVPSVQKVAQEFITSLIDHEFISHNLKITKQTSTEIEYNIHLNEDILKQTLSKKDIDEIRSCAKQIADASIKLHSNKSGIGHQGDITFGTNEQIFAILGPHTGHYYGDIVIVFKRDIMLHPDSNFTMQAATMYNEKTYKCRPWIKDPSSQDSHIKQFHSTKLHSSIPNYDYVTALELMAITGVQKQTMKVGLSDIINRWKHVDSHQVIEAHLPQLIPLNYIEHIYMPKNVFQTFPSDVQENAKRLFPNNLTLTEHNVDLKVSLLAFSTPDNSRKVYHDYILDQIQYLIKKQQEQNSLSSISQLLTLYGMTITVPGTNFQNFVTNPLTITQSYNLYIKQTDKNSRSDSIFIYWKALRGDFMLVLTNELIEYGVVKPTLVYLTCYIAPFVSKTNQIDNYNEQYTYINHRLPSSHQTVIEQQNFKCGSNTFHKGCNADDYNLYCLKIDRQKGYVTLMNAGINGIYNRTIIKCTFERNVLDLNELNYVHITAGNHGVSIRNLVISHELIPSAHPTFIKQDIINDNVNSHQKIEAIIAKPKEKISHTLDKSVDDDNDNDNKNTAWTRLCQPIKWVQKKLFSDTFDPLDMNDEDVSDDKSDNESDENSDVNTLPPCKDSIYCLDQYSKEKSVDHNKRFSHPCRFTDLCRNIHQIPHCTQFTHNQHDVPQCSQDEKCSKIGDASHRYSYRHTSLPDLLYPCRSQGKCRTSTAEHRIKYFHGEKIDLSKDKPSLKTSRSTSHQKSSIIRLSESVETRSSQKLPTTTISQSFDEEFPSVWSPEDEESDEEDLVRKFYNDDAGNSNIKGAESYDQYGNPTGRKYDLGRDGAYNEFNILIAQFYIDSQFNDAAMQVPIDALKVKGYQVKHVKTEDACITEFASNQYQIAWIISTSSITNPTFISSLTKFHSAGGAIFLFADNTPHVCHASEFLKTKFGITLEGNYYGNKSLAYKENGYKETGHFGQHEIFTGIANLFEGITICHPIYTTTQSASIFTTIATATDGNSSIAVYDPPKTSAEGRLCLDCGFTKLYLNWDAAGTARYIVNASCWLLGIEKRLKSKKKNKQ